MVHAIIVVPVGDTATWTNHDGDSHIVSNLPDNAATDIPAITLPADMGAGRFTFTEAGMYDDDCSGHAAECADREIMYPLERYDMLPFLTDGLVIVTAR